jgi:hypothetical protein
MKWYHRIMCALGLHKWELVGAGYSWIDSAYVEQKRCEWCKFLKTRKVKK